MERADLRQWVQALPGAVDSGGWVFLQDPGWSAPERAKAAEVRETAGAAASPRGWLCIPTGGTSGRIRFARHDEQTLGAAVAGFQRHFGVSQVNSVGVLPLHHVSGLMAHVRAAATGGHHYQADWRRVAGGDLPEVKAASFLSLVPTQLQRLLEDSVAVDWLRRFVAVFVGGAPTWSSLAERAATARVPLILSYGMTETAAMVAAQHPGDFLAGRRDAGTALPHARISLTDRGESDGGRIVIEGESVFRGYVGEPDLRGPLVTEDWGGLTDTGRLRVFGRRDAVIITGGEKVWPAEVEAVLRATGFLRQVVVLGVPDPQWGEAVVACHPSPALTPGQMEAVRQAMEGALVRYKHPKRFLAVEPWPENDQGKVNRTALLAAAVRS